MRPSSCKAKGRIFQQKIRDDLRAIGAKHGLEDDDVVSTGMGQSGVDIQLSPQARRLFNLAIECKSVEALSVVKVFCDHYKRYKDQPSLKLLAHKRNRTEPMVTLLWSDFLRMFEETIGAK